LPQARQAIGDHIGAIIIEAEPVNQRLLSWITENPRPRIAGLGPGSDGSDLDKAKPECFPGGNGDPVFVESGGQTDRVGEF
jgi:hypothetical protein